ncbi:MAG: hypothetical protein ABSH01_07080 [Terriglobia bacterium]|jgi:hypothetical protein
MGWKIEEDGGAVYGPIVVQRAAYEAGMKLIEDERAGRLGGDKCFWAAEMRAEGCKAEGDEEGAAFWRKVQAFAYERDVCADRGTKIVILDEGQVYREGDEDRPGAIIL